MKRAFTLLEALIAVGMILLLVGALALFVDDLGMTRERIVRNTDRARSVDAIVQAVEGALQTAVVDGERHGAGVSGTASRLRVLSSRTDAVGVTPDEMVHAAFSPLVATVVEKSGHGVIVGRAGASSMLPAEIGLVRFSYFDGTQWSETFDSLTRGRLPCLVEVAMWYDEPAAAAELPPPDRVRRIAVPDALPTDGAEVEP